jgi:hypothetical protein
MMKSHKIAAMMIVLCAIGLLLTIGDFLALHDIKNEYVSTRILESLDITLSDNLPVWTSTQGEWRVVRISYLFRFAFFVICAIVLYELVNRGRIKHREEATEDKR